MRHLMVCLILGVSSSPICPSTRSRQSSADRYQKRKKKKVDQQKQQQHGKQKYPWGEPNAGWSDRCIFYFDTHDGWIPPMCRPYGRTY